MKFVNRRQFVAGCAAASLGCPAIGYADATSPRRSVHEQLLEYAHRFEQERRQRFLRVASLDQLTALQAELRGNFLAAIGGLPSADMPPPVRRLGEIDGGDYLVEKLVYESFPNYFVPALLYRPKHIDGRTAAILSPCGHSAVGKAGDTQQILHINLTKRGYVVLTYDPVGQGERSQFWDPEAGKSRFNLVCGEHAVFGNPLYLIGSSLARYRIWDGMRGLDLLSSLDEVDPNRIGCVGNSGGGTLTAYLAALDGRIRVAAICCYITTLPARMSNRIEQDPDADPEQDVFAFVSRGIDHAGLLALCAPKPTLIGSAERDFFPIAGARASFSEARRLYEIAGAADRIEQVVAPERHGLTQPLRSAVYRWFDRWLLEREQLRSDEISVRPRPAQDLQVCTGGQVQVAFRSRPLLAIAREEAEKASQRKRGSLRELLRLDPDRADYHLEWLSKQDAKLGKVLVCISGNETPAWTTSPALLDGVQKLGYGVVAIEPRGVGRLRPDIAVAGHDYADPLVGVDENIAYNAFLCGQSLIGMRVADVLAAVTEVRKQSPQAELVLLGRRDAALVALFAAALQPQVHGVAVEELLLSYWSLFDPAGQAINAASIVPNMLRDFGDIGDVVRQIAPRRVLLAAARGEVDLSPKSVESTPTRFTQQPDVLIRWLASE